MKQTDQSIMTELLANEQTFLAWLRTGVEVMAFGFVAIKFSLFASKMMGIVLVGVGTAMIALSYFRYRTTLRQLRKSDVKYSTTLLGAVAVTVIAISLILLGCLVKAYISGDELGPTKIEKMTGN